MFANFWIFDFKVFFAEIFILLSILFILLFFFYIINNKSNKYPYLVYEFYYLLLLVISLSFFLVYNNPLTNFVIFNSLVFVDDFLIFIKLIILAAVFCCVLVSFNFIKKEKFNSFEFNLLILFSLLGLLCFISSCDLVSMFLALEVQSLAFYILATLKKDSAFSTEAGLKYFILGALSSGFLLFGISLIYGVTGTTNFECLAKLVINFDYNLIFLNTSSFSFEFTERLTLGLIFLITGFLFKMAAAPFHLWIADVYEGAPTNVALMFAVLPKIGIVFVLARLFYFVFYDMIFLWQSIIILIALISIGVGSLSSLRQLRIKRFLAFSSVTHVGFLLIAFATGTFEGLVGLFFYLIFYVLMALNIWSIVLLLEFKKKRIKYIVDLQNLARVNPVISVTFLVNLFSMAGIPPLAGFYAKSYVFLSALESSLYFLVIFAILFSVLSAFYYLRFIKVIYFDKVLDAFYFKYSISLKQAYVIGITFFIILFFFLTPESLFLIIERNLLSFFI